MKTAGWIILVLGALSFVGCLIGERNPIGPLFWIALGAFLLYRANQKEQEKRDKEKWSNDDK